MKAAMLMVCLTGSAVGQPSETVFKAPGIEVRTESRAGKTFSYLMYNRIYMGRQYHNSKQEPKLSRLATTYYHDRSPIGLVLKDKKSFPPKAEPPVAVLGMDIGTLASYAQPGQTFHFTERVPTFVKFSRPDKGGKPLFTFVQDALDRGAKLKIFEGEPREMLEKHGRDNFYQVIVIETYKLPVVEVHKELFTKEALQLLMSKLTDDGIVCYHTSDRYYQLVPIVASAARELKLACIVGKDSPDRGEPTSDFRFSSEWVMVARAEKHLAHLKNDERHHVEWQEPVVWDVSRGRLAQTKFNKEFLWTDKGEQSFRGLYNSDPEIDKLHEVVGDVAEYFNDSLGISYQRTRQASRFARDVIHTWSKSSADQKNRDSPLKGKVGEKK